MSEKKDRLSVLIVDEEPAVLALLSAMLEENGMRALRARTVAEALEIVERSYVPIDLVLTDVMLPEISGPRLFSRLLAIRPGLRVLYMSAFSEAEVVRVELMRTAGTVLSAAAGACTVVGAIREVLDERRAAAGREI